MTDANAADRARLRLGLPPSVPGDGVPSLPPGLPPLDDLYQDLAACVLWRERPSARHRAAAVLVQLVLRLAEAHPREGQILELIGMYQDVVGLGE